MIRVLGGRISIALALMLATIAHGALAASKSEQQAIKAAIADDGPKTLVPTANTGSQAPDDRTQIIPATGGLLGHSVKSSSSRTIVTNDGDIALNFINADVKDIAKAVLGDYLRLNYEIAANVQGPVTIQTSRPLPRSKVLSILDQTLRLNGMAIVFSNDIYKVVTADDAARESTAVNPVGSVHSRVPGYGVEVAPVKYISATEMQKLLEPLAPSKAIVHVDTARNVLLIAGTEQEREALLDDIALFDSDWLSGMSFALYTPNHTDAEQLVKELSEVMGGPNSPMAGVVRLVPIDRLNAVLAVSPQRRYLDQLRAWVNRLDRPGQGTDKHFYVYYVQHGRAADLAATLAKTLFGSGGSPEAVAAGPNFAAPAPNPGPATPAPAGAGAVSMAAETAPLTDRGGDFVAGSSAGGFAGIHINPDDTNNALVILATPQQYASIQDALQLLDVRPLQVFLEAAIAEVTLNDKLQFGVQYFINGGGNGQVTLADNSAGVVGPTFPGFSYLLAASNIKIALNALSTVSHVEVLSSPELMVLNNQPATLQVGDQVPILTQQSQSTIDSNAPLVNTIQYQNTGVILKVTPRVNRSGEVMMDISQEVSGVSTETSSSIQSPTIAERKIASSVVVQDGETIALGGLISHNIDQTRSGIPFLSQLPLLGQFFGDTDNSRQKTELIVLLTPHVVDNLEKARAVTEELRRKLPSVQSVLDDAH